jgi:thiol:disulfide interchange protein
MYKIIGADQKEYGPISADQVRQWISEGRVNGQTRMQAADTTEWKTVAEFPEFVLNLPRPLPPPSHAVPISPLPPQPANSQMAVWAMITGILSVLCCGLLGPIAIVLGVVALSHLKNNPHVKGRGMAIAGIALGIVALIIAILGILVIVLNPTFMQSLQNAIPQ